MKIWKRNITYLAITALAFLAWTSALPAAESVIKGEKARGFLCSDSGANRVARFSAGGKLLWEYPIRHCYDAWALPNGNVLMAYTETGGVGGVREVTPEKETVFEYKTRGEVFACQRLANGNTLIGECTLGYLKTVDPEGKVVKIIKLEFKKDGHAMMRVAHQIENGNFLVAHTADQTVREYSPHGQLLREIKIKGPAFAAVRLANGNTVVSCKDAIIEYDPEDKIVWRVDDADIPEAGPKWMAGIQCLPNGNILVSNWLGHGEEGKGVPIFEVSREKKIVWQFTDTKATRQVTSASTLDPAESKARR